MDFITKFFHYLKEWNERRVFAKLVTPSRIGRFFNYLNSWQCYRCGKINLGGHYYRTKATNRFGRKANVYTCRGCNAWVISRKAPHRWQFWRKPSQEQQFM